MLHCNILLGVDQTYYDKWAVPLLESINRHNPWIKLHCHIVNPTKDNKLDNVDITTENKEFVSDEVKISYLQSVRFLTVAKKFKNNENVITLDADTICTRRIGKIATERLFEKQYVLKHHKENRWLAGFVAFNDNGFRQEYASELTSIPIEQWRWGRDQTILNQLSSKYNFEPADKLWIAVGKIKFPSAFLTLKGEQKETSKYLDVYKKFLE
jgi:hypothetical protein